MVSVAELGFAVVLFAVAGWYGYRSITAGRLYRSLSGIDTHSTGIVDGQEAAVEGAVVVEEPAPGADSVADGVDDPVGAYVWRAWYPDAGNDYTLGETGIEKRQNTFASGIESGTFLVTDGGRDIRVDPDWIVDTHDGAALSEITPSNTQTSTPLSGRTWKSPYVHLEESFTERPFEAIEDVVGPYDAEDAADGYYLDAVAIPEGEQLSVRGEVTVEQGEPVIRGTDETPLAISDVGFDDLGSEARREALKYGVFSAALLVASGVLLSRGLSLGLV